MSDRIPSRLTSAPKGAPGVIKVGLPSRHNHTIKEIPPVGTSGQVSHPGITFTEKLGALVQFYTDTDTPRSFNKAHLHEWQSTVRHQKGLFAPFPQAFQVLDQFRSRIQVP